MRKHADIVNDLIPDDQLPRQLLAFQDINGQEVKAGDTVKVLSTGNVMSGDGPATSMHGKEGTVVRIETGSADRPTGAIVDIGEYESALATKVEKLSAFREFVYDAVCQQCGHRIQLPDDQDIYRSKCPKCGGKMEVDKAAKLAQDYDDSNEPQSDDYFLTPSGSLGGKTSVSTEQEFLGEFDSDEEAYAFIKQHSEQNNWWPNVWYVDDHGGHTNITKEIYAGVQGGDEEYIEGEEIEPYNEGPLDDNTVDTEIGVRASKTAASIVYWDGTKEDAPDDIEQAKAQMTKGLDGWMNPTDSVSFDVPTNDPMGRLLYGTVVDEYGQITDASAVLVGEKTAVRSGIPALASSILRKHGHPDVSDQFVEEILSAVGEQVGDYEEMTYDELADAIAHVLPDIGRIFGCKQAVTKIAYEFEIGDYIYWVEEQSDPETGPLPSDLEIMSGTIMGEEGDEWVVTDKDYREEFRVKKNHAMTAPELEQKFPHLGKQAVVKKNDGEYCVESEDNPDWSGGCYESKEKADDRLQDVEFFKQKESQYDDPDPEQMDESMRGKPVRIVNEPDAIYPGKEGKIIELIDWDEHGAVYTVEFPGDPDAFAYSEQMLEFL